MSKNRRRNTRPFSHRIPAVSAAPTPEETALQKSPLKNGENGENGHALAPNKDTQGRFTKGNPGGPGRPRKASKAAYHTATLGAVPLDGWEQVVAKALADAQAGDARARRWLSDYVVGRPATPPAVEGVAAPLLEQLIRLLRATDHDPEQVFESLIDRLEQMQEQNRHDPR